MPTKEDIQLLLTHNMSEQLLADFDDVGIKATKLSDERLYSIVAIETMCRSGIIAAITSDNLMKAMKSVSSEGQTMHCITIFQHKTTSTKGNALLILLFVFLFLYVCQFLSDRC